MVEVNVANSGGLCNGPNEGVGEVGKIAPWSDAICSSTQKAFNLLDEIDVGQRRFIDE